METFWSWKHHKSNTDTPAPGCRKTIRYKKIRAKSIEEAQQKAEKYYKYDFFYSTFSISTINHDGSRGLLHTGPDIPAEHKKKAYEAYHYFHDLNKGTQQLVHDYCKDNNSDWRDKSKEELETIVQELIKPFKNIELANPYYQERTNA